MNREEDEQLWDLLGRAKPAPASPFFARNVLREVRDEPRWKSSLRSWMGLRALVPATALAVALLAAMVLTHTPESSTSDQDEPVAAAAVDSDPIAQIDPQDYEVVADLDDLLAAEENNLWDDTSSL
ncbi:MAG: hypothetical protein ABJB69_01315 [Spartobacteria bacterium]